jgi:rSAM/selenodomain-associated transferase 1
MRMEKYLIVFAKEPRLGRVKSRLARNMGHVKATFWYKNQLASLITKLNYRSSIKKHLYITPDNSNRSFSQFKLHGWKIHNQGQGNLGQRMRRAVNSLKNGSKVLIGSDIPDVTLNHVQSAYKELRKSDVVFGPAVDGGYWLMALGKNQLAPALKNVRWSTKYALEDTIKNFNPKKKISFILTLNDVDTIHDFKKVTLRTSTK